MHLLKITGFSRKSKSQPDGLKLNTSESSTDIAGVLDSSSHTPPKSASPNEPTSDSFFSPLTPRSSTSTSSGGRLSPLQPHSPPSNYSHADGSRLSLRQVLENDSLASDFQIFLASEFAAENLFFYRVVSKYERPSANIDDQLRLHLAKKIYSDYLALNAPNQVNLRGEIIDSVKEKIDAGLAGYDLFEECKAEVFRLMEGDPFQRFMSLNPAKRRQSIGGFVNPTASCYVDAALIASS